MTFENFEDIASAWDEAEQKRVQKDFIGAYDIYLDILQKIITTPSLLERFQTDVRIVILATADLTILIGALSSADQLFEDLVNICKSAEYNDDSLAYFSTIKRINLALDRGELNQSRQLLKSLSPQIGKVKDINLSPSGLIQWEANCHWDGTDEKDQVVLFAHLYLAMGRLFSALGQYNDALVILDRGLFYTLPEAPSLAHQVALPLKFAIAAAYLEKGDLEEAKTQLKDLRKQFDDNQQPEALIRWLELSGKINLLQGELGNAKEQFVEVHKICRKLKLRRATVQSALNLAHVLIPLNQTRLAKDYLEGALTEAKTLKDTKLIDCINLGLQLAEARGQSLDDEDPFNVRQMKKGKRNKTESSIDNNNLEKPVSFSFQQSPNYLTLFEDRVLEFHFFLSRFDLHRANQKLCDIKEAFSKSDSELIRIRINIIEGYLSYYYGIEDKNREKINWAYQIFDKNKEEFKKLNLKPELWQVQRFLIWCFSRLHHGILEDRKIPEYSQILEDLTQKNNELLGDLISSLSPEDRAYIIANKWTDDEEYLASKIDKIQRLRLSTNKKAFFLRPWQELKLRQHLHHLLEDIDRYKDVLDKRILQNDDKIPFFSHFSQTPTFLQRIFKPLQRTWNHPKDRITLAFLVLPDRILVVRIGWLIFDFEVLPVTRLKLRNQVQDWYKEIALFNQNQRNLITSEDNENTRDLIPNDGSTEERLETDFNNISSELSRLLKFDSLLENLPKRIKALTLIPDDILHGFPFASLLDKEGRYLIEKYAISIAYESALQMLW